MKTNFCIIGGGIAGLSFAAELSSRCEVSVLEREDTPGYHTSGRSAALYTEVFFGGAALGLTKLSRPFFLDPPASFTDVPLYADLGCIFTARAIDQELLEECSKKSTQVRRLDLEEMLESVPILKTGAEGIVDGLLEPGAYRLDVAALMEGYRKKLIKNGGQLLCSTEVTGMEKQAGSWQLNIAGGETVTASKIVNAAGAWGDELAALAGLRPLGLAPLRRTIIVFDGPADMDFSAWPAVGGIAGDYYMRPETGRLMGSAADEVPSAPCDTQPEEYDIALAAYNIEASTTMEINRILHRWAGLRTFSPDRQPVAGYDSQEKDFFWLVGQGGFGIQTAPAMARAAACLAIGDSLPADFTDCGVSAESLSPRRFSQTG